MRQTKLMTPIGVVTVTAVLVGGILLGIYTTRTGQPPNKSEHVHVSSDSSASGTEKSSSAFEKIDLGQEWVGLASADETIAVRALLKLSSASPEDVVPFLKEHMAPVKLDSKRVAGLMAKLDDANVDVRSSATAELEELGVCAVPFLERALEDSPSPEVAQRLRDILAKEDAGPPASWVRCRRAIALLEHIGSDDARGLLAKLAQGRGSAMPTEDAQAALSRLADPRPTAETNWANLTRANEGKALAAMLNLAAGGEKTVALLKDQVNAGLHDDRDNVPTLPFKFRHSRPALAVPAAKCAALLLERSNDDEARAVLGALRAPGSRLKPSLMDDSVASALSPDGKRKAVLNREDGIVRNYDVAGRSLIFQIDPLQGGARCVAYSANGKFVGCGGADGTICLVDAVTGLTAYQFRHSKKAITALAFSPDGKTLASGDDSGEISYSNLWDGKLKTAESVHKGAVLALAYSADGKLLASGSADQTVRLMVVADGKELAVHESHKASVVSVAFSPDGKRLDSVDSDKTEHQWEVATGKQIK